MKLGVRPQIPCRWYSTATENKNYRSNEVGIQMLFKTLHNQLFGNHSNNNRSISEDVLKKVEAHLNQHGLKHRKTSVLSDVDFSLPPLQGRNIEEHFQQIAMKQVAPYIKLADEMYHYAVPDMPEVWKWERGWNRYDADGTVHSVPYPDEAAYVFDVETLVNGNYPVMAMAMSSKSWYAWCSDRLFNDDFIYSIRPHRYTDLIPTECDPNINPDDANWKPRLVLGHNVSFDRSYVMEQYLVQRSKMRFLDTMSMHIAISGFTSFQRVLYVAKKKGKSVSDLQDKKQKGHKPWLHNQMFDWMDSGSLNSLDGVYQFYCNGEQLDKTNRDVFVKGTIQDINNDFQNLMTYCAKDAAATLKVFQKMWKDFRTHFPSPVTLAGMLELGTAYLPVNSNWTRYLQLSEQHYQATQEEISSSLASLASEACSTYGEKDRYKLDPWLYDVDWSTRSLKMLKKDRKGLEENESSPENDYQDPIIQNVLNTSRRLPKKVPHMPGVPRWYDELCPKISDEDWMAGPVLLTLAKRITPKLLKLTWDGYPLYFTEKHGWGYVVPGITDLSVCIDKDFQEEELGDEERDDIIYPLRQARDLAYNQPLKYQKETSTLPYEVNFDKLIDQNLEKHSIPYQKSKAMWEQLRVMSPHQKELFFKKIRNPDGTEVPSWHSGVGPVKGVHIPGGWFFKLPHQGGDHNNVGNPLSKDFLAHIENGTLCSAASSDATKVLMLSMQASYWKNNRDRIRSQMVTWLNHDHLPAEVKGDDSYYPQGLYGAILPRIVTAGTVTRRAVERTWLTASNAKVDRIGSELKAMIQSPPGYHFVGADVDSQELWIASLLGDAHFAKIHGSTAIGWMTLQGSKGDATDVHSKTASLVGISRDEAKVFNYARIYGAGKNFAQKLLLQFNHRLTKSEATAKANIMYKATKGVKKSSSVYGNGEKLWSGGSESEMFNGLEATAVAPDPRTPVLGCKITKALQPQNVYDEFMTSRINWVVQSSAVDYLHLMLVSMRWLFDEFDINGRFCISIHDEVRYLVKSEDRYRAALALHITNLYTRSMFAYKLGIYDLPQSVAFFSGVDIDQCLRKESSMSCKTPSNIHSMQGSYHIADGEVLDIYQTLKQTNGGKLFKS